MRTWTRLIKAGRAANSTAREERPIHTGLLLMPGQSLVAASLTLLTQHWDPRDARDKQSGKRVTEILTAQQPVETVLWAAGTKAAACYWWRPPALGSACIVVRWHTSGPGPADSIRLQYLDVRTIIGSQQAAEQRCLASGHRIPACLPAACLVTLGFFGLILGAMRRGPPRA
jgi:hypothetical protein